ncbi:hypothetical protein NUW58_g6722 [Xylaria curta]|uniref:Uncharacterized protein n=1 Tax=Xylaria curta TaxID=42375 RepID=A0ACC1NR16_9PEZI|nr:hypothetical protein NUW58_g6722 [Xylaria curta]
MPADAFATLKPTNALARLAFSDIYEHFTSMRQGNQEAPPAFRDMVVEASQTFDRDALRLRLEREREVSQNAYASDVETSESPLEPDSDTEKQHKELGNIWTGHYSLVLKSPPFEPRTGWTVGKDRLGSVPFDLPLCTRIFAKWYGINLRNPHARLNFVFTNRAFYIANCSRSQSTQLVVNGDAVKQQPYMLNQHSMKIQLDKLEYTFQWTEYAATQNFIEERGRYVTTLGGPAKVDVDMPTPLPNRTTIGTWTLGDPLGAGGQGRVFFATNSSGEVAAIKMMERRPDNNSTVDDEVRVCNKVTEFAKKSDDDGRILRVLEVLYTNHEKFSSKVPFDIVAVVLQPMTPQTLANLCAAKNKGGSKGMKIEAAMVFRDALLALQVMHNGGWMHRDLKPANIGLIDPAPVPLVTIGYLAPELELEDYDHRIDIWAMGIILYCLTYGCHPWKFALNPWRDGKENETLRAQFRESYQAAIGKMMKDYRTARQSPTEGYIHLGALFVDMVRYQWAANNHSPRPDINEVLRHPAWGSFMPDTPRSKRRRLFSEPEEKAVSVISSKQTS